MTAPRQTKPGAEPRVPTAPRSDGIPASFRCSLQRPNTGIIEDVIALVEGAGGREVSAARKHLHEVRICEYEQYELAGSHAEDLMATVQGLAANLDPIDAEITRIEQLHFPVPPEMKDRAAALASALFSKREELVDRLKQLDIIGATRRVAADQTLHAANTSLYEWAAGLAEEGAVLLWQNRAAIRYHIEALPARAREIVALLRRAGECAAQLGNTQPKAGVHLLVDQLDGELERVLDRALGTGVTLATALTNRPRPAGPPSLEEVL